MADPVTASAVVKIILAAAAKEIGKEIGKAIANSLLGPKFSKELRDVKMQLAIINQKLDYIVVTSNKTYKLVAELPDLIEGLLDKQTLYVAHNNINSSIQAFDALDNWNDKIGWESLKSVLESWNTIIHKENRTDELIKLPYYADFLIVFTKGALFDQVKKSLSEKQKEVEVVLNSLRDDDLSPLIKEADRILKSEHIRNGSFINEPPWIRWEREKERTTELTEMICEVNHASMTRHCFDSTRTVPDVQWNNSVKKKHGRLSEIRKDVEKLSSIIPSLVIVNDVLKKYLSSVEKFDKALLGSPAIESIVLMD